MKNWVFLGIAIIAEVIATSSLKASEGFFQDQCSLSFPIQTYSIN